MAHPNQRRRLLPLSTDPLKHFAHERWWVKLTALFISQLKYILWPSSLLLAGMLKVLGLW